jgi:hypothetical protein
MIGYAPFRHLSSDHLYPQVTFSWISRWRVLICYVIPCFQFAYPSYVVTIKVHTTCRIIITMSFGAESAERNIPSLMIWWTPYIFYEFIRRCMTRLKVQNLGWDSGMGKNCIGNLLPGSIRPIDVEMVNLSKMMDYPFTFLICHWNCTMWLYLMVVTMQNPSMKCERPIPL